MPAKKLRPRQSQKNQPGKESAVIPTPEFFDIEYRASNKLQNKIAIITGGDGGMGRALAIAFICRAQFYTLMAVKLLTVRLIIIKTYNKFWSGLDGYTAGKY